MLAVTISDDPTRVTQHRYAPAKERQLSRREAVPAASLGSRSAAGHNAFIEKLSAPAPLASEDVRLLEAACSNKLDLPANHDLVREGDRPGPVFVLFQGWACRYKILPEGTRQITAFLMPGDWADLHASSLDQMEHSIATLTPARVAVVPRQQMDALIESRPSLAHAARWTRLVDEDTLRAWMASMGRRDSVQRVAHLMCELWIRSRNSGMNDGARAEVPLTQPVLADALGLTPVHVSRVLKKLRLSGAMCLSGGSLIIEDVARLAAVAGFDDAYLHGRMHRRR